MSNDAAGATEQWTIEDGWNGAERVLFLVREGCDGIRINREAEKWIRGLIADVARQTASGEPPINVRADLLVLLSWIRGLKVGEIVAPGEVDAMLTEQLPELVAWAESQIEVVTASGEPPQIAQFRDQVDGPIPSGDEKARVEAELQAAENWMREEHLIGPAVTISLVHVLAAYGSHVAAGERAKAADVIGAYCSQVRDREDRVTELTTKPERTWKQYKAEEVNKLEAKVKELTEQLSTARQKALEEAIAICHKRSMASCSSKQYQAETEAIEIAEELSALAQSAKEGK